MRTGLLHGLIFGAAAFLVTATPLTLADGATVDTRAGPVIIAAVVGGPLGGLIAAALGALSRGLVGGNFAFSGVAVYFVYAALGALLYQARIVTRHSLVHPASIITIAAASLVGASAMFFLIEPPERALAWLRNDLPLILTANLFSVTYTTFVVGSAAYFVRKNTEILELNERLELAKRAGGFGIWDYDIASDRLQWDARSAELHGLHSTPMKGSYADWAATLSPGELERIEAAYQDALAGDAPYDVEYRVNQADGSERIIKVDALIVRDEAGAPVRSVGTNLDLTKLRKTEAELAEARSIAVQAQKFDTIGKMTGGVAHDFNNILAIVMGNQELLRDEIKTQRPDMDAVDELIEASLQATQRGAELTQNLLAYARQARLTPEPLDLNKVVRQTETWLRRTIESRVAIDCVLQAGLWPMLADRASLQSALVNLLINARDALDGPGKVTIETANVRIDPDYVEMRSEDIRPGRYVMLAVTDTGPGIAPDLINDIFDPFVTTKPVGKGTGLGLSMVQGFVKQSGGAIRVYSEPGAGASFKLYFPAADDTSAPTLPQKAPTAAEIQAVAGARILVVEDQEDLLDVIVQTLRKAGYAVVACKTGDAAYDFFKADPDFALVATDIVMPGKLQGPALAKVIREIDPGMRFIFFSGYAREAVLQGNGLRAEDISLMKPISKGDLLAAIRTALTPG